jgi:3-oxoacyl-[acyl-carrier protein] reductase
MDLGLDGWRVLVTGATNGIGRAIVETLVAEGAAVAGCGRTPGGPLPEGVRTRIYEDLVEPEAPARVIDAAVDALGGLDAVVSGAGRGINGSVESTDEDTWQEGLNLNLLSVARLARLSLPHLRERGGRILVVTALSGSEPQPDHVVSNSAKAAAAALAKSLSREVAAEGILVNCLAPGRIMSGQIRRNFPSAEQRDAFARQRIPVGRFGEPEEAAPFAALLISPRNTYVTGQTLHVDGGMAQAL